LEIKHIVADGTKTLDELVREHIMRVLAEHNGNVSAAARALGMHRRSLQRKLNRQSAKQPVPPPATPS
jgi:two-component system response regulator RegA